MLGSTVVLVSELDNTQADNRSDITCSRACQMLSDNTISCQILSDISTFDFTTLESNFDKIHVIFYQTIVLHIGTAT